MHIIDAREELSAETICGLIFQRERCILNDDSILNWSINITQNEYISGYGSKSKITNDDHYNLNIVQITDTHYDPKYKEGSNAVCFEPACCREDQVNCSPKKK